MSARKVKIDDISNEINKIMKEYSSDVTSVMMKDIDSVARQTVNKVKEKAPVRKGTTNRHYKGSGKSYPPGTYKKSWGSKVTEQSATRKNRTVYSKGQGSLTHLLENGHASRYGGRVKAIPHIKEAEEYAVNELVTRLKRRIEHGL